MSDKEIGQVSVRVRPNTSKFAEEANDELDKAEKELDDLEVDVVAHIDDSTLAEEAKAAEEKAQKAIGSIDIKVNLDDRSSLQQALAQLDKQLANLSAVKIPVDLDEPSLKAAKELLTEELRKVGEVGIKVNLDDEASLRAAMAKIDAELKKLSAIEIPVNLNESDLLTAKALLYEQLGKIQVPISPTVGPTEIAEVEAELAVVTRRRTIDIDMNLRGAGIAALSVVSVLSGWDALEKNIIQVHRQVTTLFTELPAISAGAAGAVALAGALFNAAAGAAALVQNLFQAIPVLLAIPGIAIGLGLTAVAFANLNDVLPEVVANFKTLAPLIQGSFWSQAAAPISALANGLFPALRASVEQTSIALGDFFGDFATAIGSIVTGNVLQSWFTNLTLSIQVFSGHVEGLATIFKLFGDVGSAVLPPLAAIVGQLVDAFAVWFQGLVDGAGGVEAFANNAVSAFAGILSAILAVANLVTTVLGVASESGTNAFAALATTINSIATAIQTGPLGPVLKNLFETAAASMSLLTASLGPALVQLFITLGTVLANVLPSIAGALAILANGLAQLFSDPRVTQGLTDFLLGVSNGIAQLAPLFAPIGAIIGALGPVLGTLANTIGTVFASLTPTISTLITALGPIITLLGGTLANALIALSPLITTIGNAIGSILTALAPALAPVLAVLNVLISTIVPPLTALIESLVPPLTAIITAILPPLATVIGAIAPVLGQLVGVVLAALAPLLTALAPILGQVAILFSQLVTALMPIITVLAELITALLPPLIEIIQLVLAVAMVPLQLAVQGLVVVLQILGEILKWVVEEIIIPFVIPIITQLVHVIAGVLIPIFEALGKSFKAVWDFVKSIWDAFKLLFQGDFTGFWNAIKAAYSKLGDAMGEIWSAAWEKIKEVLKSAIIKINQGVAEGFNAIIDWFKSLGPKILSFVTGLNTLLLNAGKQLIQGLLDGIQSQFNKVKDKLSELTNLLPDWKGPATKDATLLYDSGRLVIDGFLDGLESRYDAVRKSLGGFTNSLGGTAVSIPGANVGLGTVSGSLGASPSGGNTIIYNAAAGSSLGAEEDLFDAVGRARAFGW